MGLITSTLQRFASEVSHIAERFEEQHSLNEVLCAENCVARWFWKNGRLSSNSLIFWDLESVNTCPENYQSHDTVIAVEAAGLYELTMAFFAKKKNGCIRIMVNEECVSVKQMDSHSD